MKKKLPKEQTTVVIPVGRWASQALAAVIGILVVSLWAVDPPGAAPRFVLDVACSVTGFYLLFLLLKSDNVTVERSRRKGLRSVAPGLWQGGLGWEKFSFDDYDLDVVVDLRTDQERPDETVKVPAGKLYVRWPMIDRALPDTHVLAALAYFIALNAATGKVGVFCNMGMNRSGLVCGASARAIVEITSKGLEQTMYRVFNEDFAAHLAGEVEPLDEETPKGTPRFTKTLTSVPQRTLAKLEKLWVAGAVTPNVSAHQDDEEVSA